MSTRPRLDTTLLQVHDVADQPAGGYLFIVEGLLGPRQAFSIDSWIVSEESVTGKRRGAVIIEVPVRAPWAIVNRADITLATVAESARKRKEDDVAQANFEEELYPKGATSEVAPALGYRPGPGVYA